MTKSELQQFIDGLDDAQKATDLIRCCSCGNAVLESGKYSIKKHEGAEGVLCEDCNKEKRDIVKTIKVVDSGLKTVNYVTIERQQPAAEVEEEPLAKAKEVVVEDTKPKPFTK